jgi:MoxR-like ATPase
MSNKTNSSDIQVVSLRQAAEHVRLAIELQDPLMLWGLMGIGKSAIVRQIAKESGRPFVDIRLSTLDPTEFSGIPYFDACAKVLKRAVSDLFPSDSNSDAIILIDELPDAPAAMQSAAYRLILDRELGNGVRLPEDVSILAAGNTAAAHGGGGNMLSPLANRLDHLEVEVNTEEFLEDYGYKNLHPLISSLLKVNPHMIHTYKHKSQRAFATPRSLEKTSNKLFALEKRFGKGFTNNELTERAVASCIGTANMAVLRSHLALDGKLPSMIDVLNGTAKDLDKDLLKEAGIKYLLATNVITASYNLARNKKENWETQLENALNYLERNKDGDDISMLVLSTIWSSKSEEGDVLRNTVALEKFLSPEMVKAIVDSANLG